MDLLSETLMWKRNLRSRYFPQGLLKTGYFAEGISTYINKEKIFGDLADSLYGIVGVSIGWETYQLLFEKRKVKLPAVRIWLSTGRYLSAVKADLKSIGIPQERYITTISGRFKIQPTNRYRPVFPGISISHIRGGTGTLGAIVRRGRAKYILSNNHILANINQASVGDSIIQPGSGDGGTERDTIAELTDFKRIFLRRPNNLDVAIAEPIDYSNILTSIWGKIPLRGTTPARFGSLVFKCGRTTVYTEGRITDLAGDFKIDYGNGLVVEFRDQLVIEGLEGDFSKPGDSGSLIWMWDENMKNALAVGLLFAGSEKGSTLANSITGVLNYFGVRL